MKCPFCTVPCGNEYCAYNKVEEEKEESECEDCHGKSKGLIEENKRLLDTIRALTEMLRGRQ